MTDWRNQIADWGFSPISYAEMSQRRWLTAPATPPHLAFSVPGYSPDHLLPTFPPWDPMGAYYEMLRGTNVRQGLLGNALENRTWIADVSLRTWTSYEPLNRGPHGREDTRFFLHLSWVPQPPWAEPGPVGLPRAYWEGTRWHSYPQHITLSYVPPGSEEVVAQTCRRRVTMRLAPASRDYAVMVVRFGTAKQLFRDLGRLGVISHGEPNAPWHISLN